MMSAARAGQTGLAVACSLAVASGCGDPQSAVGPEPMWPTVVTVASDSAVLSFSGEGAWLSVCDRTPPLPELLTFGTKKVDGESVPKTCEDMTAKDLAGYSYSWLDLGNLGITSLQAGDFAGLSGLEWLRVYGNQLVLLPEGVFAGLSGLESLGLGGNQLVSLPEGVFAGLSGLKWLGLGGNQLVSLPEGVFAGLSGLKWLGLGGNQLVSLPEGVFAGLSGLEELWLR